MVNSCVAFGCNNIQDARIPISYHSFPFKRPNILELWVKAVGRENWFPSKSSRLCGEHFLPSDFQDRPGCILRLLKPDAVPSVFLFSDHVSHEVILLQNIPITLSADTLDTEELIDIKQSENEEKFIFPSTSTTKPKVFTACGTQTPKYNDISLLRRKIKTLEQKIRRRDMKIIHMKDIIKKISKSGHSDENLDDFLESDIEDYY